MKHADLIQQRTLEEKASLCSGKDFWQTKNIDRLSIPSMFLSDGPHGAVSCLLYTSPSPRD